jgi:Tol biopolymer transport system component
MRPYRFLLLVVLTSPVWAAGKNKVQTESLNWRELETEHFTFFYYDQEAHLLEKVSRFAETSYQKLSDLLQHQIQEKIPFIFYKTHEEFEKTTIYPGFLPRAVGAFAEPFQSRMVLPVDMTDDELRGLISHELTHIFQYDMLYNNRISTIIRAQAPTWFTEGMASYLGDDETNLDRMVLRDAAINGNFFSLSQVAGLSFLAYRIGHAVFDFMEENWGLEGIRNFLWQYRKNITGRIEIAIKQAFEIEGEEFDRRFRKYLRKRYIADLPEKEEPDDHALEIRSRKVFTTLSPALSPSGDLFAAIVPVKNKLDLVLVSTKDGKIFENLTKDWTTDYTEILVRAYEGKNDISWSADGEEIAFTARREGTARLFVVNVLTHRFVEDLQFEGVRDIQSPTFAPDGDTLYFVANQNGQFDVFSYHRIHKELKNLTQDEAKDINPQASSDRPELVYSSFRDGFYKIFALDLDTLKQTQLTSGVGNDIQASFSQDHHHLFFSSDRFSDTYNIYSLDLEAGSLTQYTNILTGAFAPQERTFFDHRESQERTQLLFTAYYEGRFRIYRMNEPEKRGTPYSVEQDNWQSFRVRPELLTFKIDPESGETYRPKKHFSVSNANVSVGVTDDSRFISVGDVSFSDVLGIHTLRASVYTISSYESYYVDYINRKNRWNWGGSFRLRQYFLVDPFFSPGDRLERLYKNISLSGFLSYPFSTFTRVDAGAGFRSQDYYQLGINEEDQFFYQPVDYDKPFAYAAFSLDTVRYSYLGPIQGQGLDLVAEVMQDAYRTVQMRYRAYMEMTRRSSFALRVEGDYSDGDTPDLFFLGGINNLRGDFYYNQFVGTRRFLSTAELRFPLLDAINFPFGLSFRNIRGAFYVEVGGAWHEDDSFNWEFEDSDTWSPEQFDRPEYTLYNYLIGTYGLDVHFNMMGAEFHWTFSKRTNFDTFPSGSQMSFWIGYQF